MPDIASTAQEDTVAISGGGHVECDIGVINQKMLDTWIVPWPWPVAYEIGRSLVDSARIVSHVIL